MTKEISEEEKKAQETVEEIAREIVKLSRQVDAILKGRLKLESIVTLLVHSTKMSRNQVRTVLLAIADLENDNLKK